MAQFQIRELDTEHRAHSPNHKIASTAVYLYLRHLMIHHSTMYVLKHNVMP